MGYINTYGQWISDDELLHYGVSKADGAKRGSGRYPLGSGERPNQRRGIGGVIDSAKSKMREQKTVRMAKKDAKRYADAKMFYGEGAGNRRKLLKAELNKKMGIPGYKEVFDREVENADYAKSAKRAQRERKARDVKKGILGSKSLTTLATTALTAGTMYYLRNKDEVDSHIRQFANDTISNLQNEANRAKAQKFLRRMGL